MFELEVVDVFHIGNKRTVFTGKVAAGKVKIGDNLVLRSPVGKIPIVVEILEPRGLAHAGAIKGDNIAIITERLDLEPVADGIRQQDANHYEILSLKLQSPEFSPTSDKST